MNSRQLQYAVLLSKVCSFSQLAEDLKISQPALSKQIISLEKELGVQLFDREFSPLRLTPAGEQFVQQAQDLLYREDQLLRSMERFRLGEEGRLVIGVSPFRCLYLLTDTLKKVRERYPKVQICLQEWASDRLRREAAEGRYDFAVVNLPVDTSVLDVTPIEPDTLVLAVPNSLCHILHGSLTDARPQLSMADCSELPFVAVSRAQELRRLFDGLCAKAGFHPIIAMEVVGVATAWEMVRAGIGAALLPLQFVEKDLHACNVTVYALKDSVSTRQPVIITRRGQYLSEYAQYAMELLQEGNNKVL